MKTYTEIFPSEAWNVYKYRGALTVVDRVNQEKDFLHESFIDEMSKQLSPQIAATLGTTVKNLKKGDEEIGTNQYLDYTHFVSLHNDLYISLHLLLRNFGASFWAKCTCVSPENTPVDPRSDVSQMELKFKLIYALPEDVKRLAFKYILDLIENTDDLQKKETLEINFKNLMAQEVFDEWILYFKDILGITIDLSETMQ